jgi:hypothetical protein
VLESEAVVKKRIDKRMAAAAVRRKESRKATNER